MSQVSVNNDPLHERLMFGFDGSDYRVVKVDTDGNLVAAIKATQSIEVTQDTAADLKATVNIAADQNVQSREYGWIGAAWQKSPLLMGYSSDKSEQQSDLNAIAGNNVLYGSTVPAGEVWRLQAMAACNLNSVTTQNILGVVCNGVWIRFYNEVNKPAGIWSGWTGEIILSESDYAFAWWSGCTAGDDLYFQFHAITVDIDQ